MPAGSSLSNQGVEVTDEVLNELPLRWGEGCQLRDRYQPVIRPTPAHDLTDAHVRTILCMILRI
jgi:hypothetical protein